jgi:hypothetical protein
MCYKDLSLSIEREISSSWRFEMAEFSEFRKKKKVNQEEDRNQNQENEEQERLRSPRNAWRQKEREKQKPCRGNGKMGH